MTRIVLVRHGRAAAGWNDHLDPGLDDVGVGQAQRCAVELAPMGPLPVVSSPLRRCRETAEAICALWGTTASIEPAVGEIPSPTGVPMDGRVEWLQRAMRGTWADLGERYTAFRDGVVRAVRSRDADCVVVSHFVAINAVIGAAVGDDRLVIHRLDNCSATVVETDGERLRVVSVGGEADTLIR